MKAFLLFISLLISFQDTTEEALLISGLEAESAGNYEQALEIWGSALTKLNTPSLAIGREYIRLSAEQKLKEKYKSASVMYLWGLSANKVEPNRDALEQEIAFLEPLIDRFGIKDMRRLLAANDPAVYGRISAFWEQVDPTPSTAYNERLLEHWERIAYARSTFTENDDTVFGTDDRGFVYVEYGPPDNRWQGRLEAFLPMIEMACTQLPLCPPPPQILPYHQRPRYEIWSYFRPDDSMLYDHLLIFGNNNYGGFGQVNTLEEFIPANAWSLGNRYEKVDLGAYASAIGREAMASATLQRPSTPNKSGVSAGMVLSFIYYDQLKSYHALFANTFTEMDIKYNDIGQKFIGQVVKERTLRRTIVERNKAPEEISTYLNEFPAIPMEVYHYRLLNDEGEPVTASFVESKPKRVFLEDVAHNQDVLIGEDSTNISLEPYELYHGLEIRNSEGYRISQGRQQARLIIDRSEEELPSSSVFTIPQGMGEQVEFYAELHNEHPDTEPMYESSFENSMRGIGKLEAELPEPLSADPTQLQMSDLILGYDLNPDAGEGVLFPFYVSHSRKIPQGKELALHFEVYHLDQDLSDISSFDLEYSITPKGRMDWIKSPENEITLTLDFQTNTDRFSEDLSIQTRELKPGKYTLNMTATDRETGQIVEREVVFEVVNL